MQYFRRAIFVVCVLALFIYVFSINKAFAVTTIGTNITAGGTVAGSNLSGTNTGDETQATIKTKLGAATASVDGYLTSANWSTFNGKQDALGFTSVVSGVGFTLTGGATPKTLTVGNTASVSGTNTGDQVVPSNEAGASNNFFTAYNSTTGAFSKAQPTWANIDKTTSSLADITTRSHTALTDIGTNTHAQIDTFIGTTVPATYVPYTGSSADLVVGAHAVSANSFTLSDTSGKTIFGNGAGAANTNTDLTAFGKSAAAVNSDTGVAVGNTAVGYEAMKTNISGHLNVALGYQSLKASLGSGNVALGGDTLTALTTGEHVTAVGAHALKSITTANGNDAFGYAALQANTTGSNNLAFGVQALTNNIDGDENIAIGYQALTSQTSGGYYNVAIGPRALAANVDADYNIAIGRNSLTSLQTGNMNEAIGYGTLTALNGGYYQNTAIGAQALGAKTAGSENTAIGAKAGYSDLTGVQNTIIGNQAGYTMTTGSRNVLIGNYAGYYETGSDKLFVDNALRASEADARTKALIYGVFDAAVANQSVTINGTVTSQGNIIAGGSTSVIRLKGYTVATLPAGTQGDTAFVTDATVPTFLGTLTGSGAVVTPVFYNGSAWVAY